MSSKKTLQAAVEASDPMRILAETYIGLIVEGVDYLSGKVISGKCFGVDTQSQPMGKRGIFLVVQGPTTLTNYKIDFSTFTKKS